MILSPYWRAEVYLSEEQQNLLNQPAKVFAGIYAKRENAEHAAQRKCQRMKGDGFKVHCLNAIH